ncbi:hypothetical protein [uncultured Mediterranean phage]|nr:hypothetical protein [uncultured Mediterranean phage]
MKSAHVIFENPKYNYFTSVNGGLSDNEIKQYFEGKNFNLGGMGYDHETNQETETDNVQQCVKCYVSSFESGASNHALNDLMLYGDNTRETAEELNRIFTMIKDNEKADFNYLLRQYLLIVRRAYLREFNHKGAADHIKSISKDDVKEWVLLYRLEFQRWLLDN